MLNELCACQKQHSLAGIAIQSYKQWHSCKLVSHKSPGCRIIAWAKNDKTFVTSSLWRQSNLVRNEQSASSHQKSLIARTAMQVQLSRLIYKKQITRFPLSCCSCSHKSPFCRAPFDSKKRQRMQRLEWQPIVSCCSISRQRAIAQAYY